jgi:hypothetical protein
MADSPHQPSSPTIYDFNKLYNARRAYKVVSGTGLARIPKGGSNCGLNSFYRFGFLLTMLCLGKMPKQLSKS